jgi:ubiquinone/menaquinone biosynthesis C-methylase UbiE
MLQEIYRVLSPTGIYICISHGREDQRKRFLKDYKKFNWTRIKHLLPKPQIG